MNKYQQKIKGAKNENSTIKARDMKTAMNLVNDEYGDKAIILSTKRNNGVVEVEASDNDKIIETHKKKVEEKKIFESFQ